MRFRKRSKFKRFKKRKLARLGKKLVRKGRRLMKIGYRMQIGFLSLESAFVLVAVIDMYDPNHINNADSGFAQYSSEDLRKALDFYFSMRSCSRLFVIRARRIIKVLKHRKKNALF